MKEHPRFRDFLSPATITMIYKSAPLHDIGKVGVPDNILLKPGKLTDEEFVEMRLHTVYGRDAIVAAQRSMTHANDFLELAIQITYSHHEKWDGSGYPEGLAGEDIPIAARLMAIADVYDALASRRVYKAAIPHEKSVTIIAESRGTHFDPDMVDAFMDVANAFRTIAEEYADTDGPGEKTAG